jgi:putative transposase
MIAPRLAGWRGPFDDVLAPSMLAPFLGRPLTFKQRTWAKRCPGVVTSLREGGNELLAFFGFPKAQWKTLRTTNTIERLHEEFRRRVKTQGALPNEDAALILLFSLVASGQIRLRRIDGWRKIATVLRQHAPRAA